MLYLFHIRAQMPLYPLRVETCYSDVSLNKMSAFVGIYVIRVYFTLRTLYCTLLIITAKHYTGT